jgi:hypothetical protein
MVVVAQRQADGCAGETRRDDDGEAVMGGRIAVMVIENRQAGGWAGESRRWRQEALWKVGCDVMRIYL